MSFFLNDKVTYGHVMRSGDKNVEKNKNIRILFL